MKSSNVLRSIGLIPAMALSAIAARASDAPEFTVHEWDTFTSVSGSDGVLLPGLEQEEESLPDFVFQHDGMASRSKGYLRPLHNVTIKMETPVIYFYASQPFAARVHVGFNGGSISQWYPNRSGGETPPAFIVKNDGTVTGGDIDFAKAFKGGIEWNIRVQPSSADDGASVFKPGETPAWLYPRQTDSALVRAPDGTAEKFLFYRGVGNFGLPVKFTLPDDRTLRIQNNSDAAIPALLIFNHPKYDDRVSFTLLNPLEAGGARTIKLSEPSASAAWRHEVYAAMRGALVEAGLFPKEADAMVQTWWASYFERPGLRAFWIVPDSFTRAVLPLTVEPAPRQQVRVLVGRSELLTPAFEYELLTKFAKGTVNPLQLLTQSSTGADNALQSDRFSKAYEARVGALRKR